MENCYEHIKILRQNNRDKRQQLLNEDSSSLILPIFSSTRLLCPLPLLEVVEVTELLLAAGEGEGPGVRYPGPDSTPVL